MNRSNENQAANKHRTTKLRSARVRLENLTPEQVENTIEQVRQGNRITNINQLVQQEEQLENKEAIEEIKIEILIEFFKTHSMNIEEREPLLKLEKENKKIKNQHQDWRKALNQTIKDIKPKDTKILNKLTYSAAKAITESCSMKKKKRNRKSHKQSAWKSKIQKEIEAVRGELYIPEDLSKGINTKTRKGRKVKRRYKLQIENDITTTKERINKIHVKAQKIRRSEK